MINIIYFLGQKCFNCRAPPTIFFEKHVCIKSKQAKKCDIVGCECSITKKPQEISEEEWKQKELVVHGKLFNVLASSKKFSFKTTPSSTTWIEIHFK